MREQIERLLHAKPFEPFALEVAEDVMYSIPTSDHVWLAKKVLAIEDDDGVLDLIPYQHIRRIRVRSLAA